MIVERVRLENLKSYVDVTIELRPGINVIAGPNGVGKSTLVEAIGLALFNAVPPWTGGTLRQLVRRGATQAAVTVWFAHAGHRFSVQRTLHKPSWTVFDATGRALTDGHVGETAEWLRLRLGVRDVAMDKLFSDMVGTYQGCFTAPFEASPDERVTRFERMLQVEEWRVMAGGLVDRANKALRPRLLEVARAQAGLEQRIEDRRADADALAARAEARQAAEAEVARAQREAAARALELADAETAARALREAAAGVRAAGAAAAGHQAARAAAAQAVAAGETALAEREAARAGQQAYAEADAARTALESLRGERERWTRERAAAEREAGERRALADERAGEVARRGAALAGEEAAARAALAAAQACAGGADAASARAREAVAAARAALPPVEAREAAARTAEREAAALADLIEDARARLAAAAEASGELGLLEQTAARAARLAAARGALDVVREREAALLAQIGEKRGLVEGARRGRCPLLDDDCPHPRGGDLAGALRGDIAALEAAAAAARTAVLAAAGERTGAEAALAELTAVQARRDAVLADLGRVGELLAGHARRAAALLGRRGRRGLSSGRVSAGSSQRDGAAGAELASAGAALRAGDQLSAEVTARVQAALAGVLGEVAAARERSRACEAALAAAERVAGEGRAALAAAQRESARVARAADELARARAAALTAAEAAALAAHQVERLSALAVRFVGLDERLAEVAREVVRTRPDHERFQRADAQAAGLDGARAGLAAARRALDRVDRERRAAVAALVAALAGVGESGGAAVEGERLGQALHAAARGDEVALLAAADGLTAGQAARAEAARERVAGAQQEVIEGERGLATAAAALAVAVEAAARIERWRVELQSLEQRKARLEETQRVAAGLATHVLKRAGARIAERQVERVGARAAELYRRIAPGDNLELRWNPSDYGVELCGQIDGHEDTLVFQQLSGGQKMTAALAVRLSLVRAFAGRIGLVCLDEPTTHLDQGRRGELAEALARLRADGGSWFEQLLLVSHDDAFEALDDCRVTLALDPQRKATRVEGSRGGDDGAGAAAAPARPGRRRAANRS